MKEYTPLSLIENGRFKKLYENEEEKVKNSIRIRLQKYIDECPYKDEKNFGHLCNLLTVMAVYEALQEKGLSKEDAIEEIKKAMYSCVEPMRIKNEKEALEEGYIEKIKKEHQKEMEETYGIGWELAFPECAEREFTYRIYTCIYNETFKRYHYPELGPLFCHVDNILNDNLEKIDFSYTGQLCVNQKTCDYTFRYKSDTEK